MQLWSASDNQPWSTHHNCSSMEKYFSFAALVAQTQMIQTDASALLFFLKKKHFFFKKLKVFDSCKQRCSKIHLTQRLSPLMCFHSKLVNVSITVFKAAVDFCAGMKVGLRNVSNENNYLCFLMLERHYFKSLCSLWNHVMERKGLGRKSMENKT